MGIPEGDALEPPTVLFIAHWRLLILKNKNKWRLSTSSRPML
jgi:hypothetical protein